MALFGLFQCFNGNFAASTRLLFAYARRGTVAPRFATIHIKFSTPSVAVLGITAGTLVGLLLGDAILVPVTEVGSMASALGWLAACLSFWLVESRSVRNSPQPASAAGRSHLDPAEHQPALSRRRAPRIVTRIITALGICVSLLLLLMKLVPAFPGHFTKAEWIALSIWLTIGAILHRRQPAPAPV